MSTEKSLRGIVVKRILETLPQETKDKVLLGAINMLLAEVTDDFLEKSFGRAEVKQNLRVVGEDEALAYQKKENMLAEADASVISNIDKLADRMANASVNWSPSTLSLNKSPNVDLNALSHLADKVVEITGDGEIVFRRKPEVPFLEVEVRWYQDGEVCYITQHIPPTVLNFRDADSHAFVLDSLLDKVRSTVAMLNLTSKREPT